MMRWNLQDVMYHPESYFGSKEIEQFISSATREQEEKMTQLLGYYKNAVEFEARSYHFSGPVQVEASVLAINNFLKETLSGGVGEF